MFQHPNWLIAISCMICVFGVTFIFFKLIDRIERGGDRGRETTFFFMHNAIVEFFPIILVVMTFMGLEVVDYKKVDPFPSLTLIIGFWIIGILLVLAKVKHTVQKIQNKSMDKTQYTTLGFIAIALISSLPIIGVVVHMIIFSRI